MCKLYENETHLPGTAVLSLVSLMGRCEGKMLIHPHVDIQRFVMTANDYLYLQRKPEG